MATPVVEEALTREMAVPPAVDEAISGEPAPMTIPQDDVRLEGRMRPEETQRELEELVKPRSEGPLPSQYLERIKKLEDFDPVPRFDVRQWTVGWGTRAKDQHERPTVEQLEQRFADEIGHAAMVVDHVNPHLPEAVRAALTSLTFNAGAKWIGHALGDAVRMGDPALIARQLLTYSKVPGEKNPVLRRKLEEGVGNRRKQEVAWFMDRPPADIPNVRQAVHHHAKHAHQAPQRQRPVATTGFRSYEPM